MLIFKEGSMIAKIQRYCFISLFFLLLSVRSYTFAPNTVVATIGVGDTPNGLAVTPNNRFAYVANNNNDAIAGGNTVSVLNLATNTVLQTISDPSFNQPYTVTINAAGTKAYVTNSYSTTISIIDIATNTVTGIISGFDGPSGMVISPTNSSIAYVNNYGADGDSGLATTVSVVDLSATPPHITHEITVDLAPAALAITPDGAYVYVANYVDGNPGTGTVDVIQTSDNRVTTTITGFSGPFNIAMTPDGTKAYVTNFGSNNFSPIGTTVSVIDIGSNTISATIPLGIQPAGIAITPDGHLAYATNYDTLYTDTTYTNLVAGPGTVNIIDIATDMVISPTIMVGLSPDAVAISSNGQYAYVSNYTSNTVSVIALSDMPFQIFQITAQGCRTQNVFLTQRDIINKLTWSGSGTLAPTSYSIYRDAALTDLVATIPATGPLQFLDHNRQPNVIYTYYLIASDDISPISNPVAITVTQNC